MADNGHSVRLAAVADLHCTEQSRGAFQGLFREASRRADALLLGGDLTDYGREAEALVLAGELRAATLPVLAVLGNHDMESGQAAVVRRILVDAGVVMLDGSAYLLGDVGIAGVKGFVGGFGRRALAPWGETSIKHLVQECVDEAIKLESALVRLWTPVKVALLHYAPIQATLLGEPAEVMPFLGSSRLEEVVDRFRVHAVFHGHAHRGSPEGRTRGNVPVYNVALPVLVRVQPDQPPLRIVELPVGRRSAAVTEPLPAAPPPAADERHGG